MFTMYCPDCEKEREAYDAKCPHCGSKRIPVSPQGGSRPYRVDQNQVRNFGLDYGTLIRPSYAPNTNVYRAPNADIGKIVRLVLQPSFLEGCFGIILFIGVGFFLIIGACVFILGSLLFGI
jgi:hypothetical protein